MFYNVAVLKIELGDYHNDITLRDIQLWRKSKNEETDENSDINDHNRNTQLLKGKFCQYINITRLPIWLQKHNNGDNDEQLICFTTSSTTLAYFESKLRYNDRGIVIEICQNDVIDTMNEPKYLVFYKVDNLVEYFYIDVTIKKKIDSQIKMLKQSKKKLNDNKLDNIDTYKNRNIDKILRQAHERNMLKTNKIIKSLQISDKRLQFNETLSKLILGGFRLRGILNTHTGFHKLYKTTFDAAGFTHRDEIEQLSHNNIQEIPFESLQETVEVLLKLFTKS